MSVEDSAAPVAVEGEDNDVTMTEAAPEGEVKSEEAKVDDPKKNYGSGKTIIVKKIPASLALTYQDALKELFGKYGTISYIKRGGICVDYDTVSPTLAAYVNFDNAESSDKAMEENGKLFHGSELEIKILRSGAHTVVLNNIPSNISCECLHNLLSCCGDIKDIIKIPSRPTAFIEFEAEEGLKKAISLSGIFVNNEPINIQKRGLEQTKSEKKGKGGVGRRTAAAAAPRRPVGGVPQGGVGWRGGRGGGMNFNRVWDAPPVFRQPNMGPPLNNWGNGGNFQNNNGVNRGNKRRKQNDWIRQY